MVGVRLADEPRKGAASVASSAPGRRRRVLAGIDAAKGHSPDRGRLVMTRPLRPRSIPPSKAATGDATRTKSNRRSSVVTA
jgi:hypothetical protein